MNRYKLIVLLFITQFITAQNKSIEVLSAYDSIAKLVKQTKNKDSVLHLLNLQKEIAVKADNKKQLADVLYELGKNKNYGEDLAITNLQEAITLYKELEDITTVAKANIVLARAYQSQSKYDEAFKYVNESLSLAQDLNDKGLIINAYSFRSNIYGNFSQTDNAIKDLNKAQKIAMRYKDGEKLIPIIQSKSFLYYSKGYYKESVAAVKEMLAFFKKKDNLRSGVIWRNNLGMIYASCSCVSLEEEKQNLRESIALANEINFHYGKSYAATHIARAFMKESKYDSAYNYLSKADKNLPQKVNPSFLGYLNQIKGDYWANTGNKRKAIVHFEKAFTIWNRLKKYKDKQYVSKHLSDFYSELNNSTKAYKYLKAYTAANDSLVNKEKIEKEKELELTYEFDKKQYRDSIKKADEFKVLDLQNKNKIQEEKHVQQILLALFVLALVLGGFAYYAYQRKKKTTAALNNKNEIIEKALYEKQLLLKEVHHRVKNNFQIVSSLLELQTKGIEDEKALSLANEGKNRVKSMALIHQKLYQNDTGLINFDEYIRVLVKELSSMYSSEKKIETNISSTNMEFDVDTAIPLGLIVNELITNAYKYAFEANENNKLNIVIDKLNDEEYKLTVSDNGKGFDSAIDLSKVKSLGLRLVKRLTKQLQGKFVLNNTNGASFEITFKDTNTRALLD